MADFHFIRPLWLLALITIPLIIWLIKRLQISQSGWSKILPPHLSSRMIEQGNNARQTSTLPAVIIYLLTIIALAGPTWQKLPQPVYQVERGSVLIMDMSYSMYATDIAPNRLTRARYKAIDLLDSLNEGDIGLIAYAGDAFVISPLTEDINNIKLLLPSLSPDLMPELGSNPLAALTLAHEMLTNSGHIEGDIYWLTDGIDGEDVEDINDWSNAHNHRLNILGIGTAAGAPIKLTNGELLKDDNGAIVIPKLSEQYLYGVAANGRGQYRTITNDVNDITALINATFEHQQQEKENENLQSGDQWQEAGPYLVIPILLLLLGYFRRGALLSILPIMLWLVPADKTLAVDWQSLWKTKDQQGQQAFNQQQYQQAAESFKNNLWQGSAHYKAGNYQEAANTFAKANTAQGFYNQGNALAKMQKLDEAIKAYEKALELESDHKDAQANKALLEQLKKQQQQQNQDQSQSGDNQQDGDNQEQPPQDQQNEQQGDQQQDQQQDQQGQEQSGDQQQDNQQQQQGGSESQNQSEQQSSEQSKNNSEQSESGQQNKEQQQNQEAQAQEAKAEQADGEEQKAQQLTAAEQQANQEKEQKHQQLLKKVTDDPYLLLRNKMQLEYQKRRQNGTNNGAKKKW